MEMQLLDLRIRREDNGDFAVKAEFGEVGDLDNLDNTMTVIQVFDRAGFVGWLTSQPYLDAATVADVRRWLDGAPQRIEPTRGDVVMVIDADPTTLN